MKGMFAPSEMDDLALWSLLVKGDTKALEVLYQRYYSLLLNYGLKCYLDRELVKDCIQDLFVSLYKNTHIKTNNITVRSYLLRALRNNIINKTSTQREDDFLQDSIFLIPSDEDLFEKLFPKNDRDLLLTNQLLESISQLSSNQKTVLYLRYVKELSYQEISDIMDVNVQSSMNLASRALAKLRALMKQDEQLWSVWQLLLIRIVLASV